MCVSSLHLCAAAASAAVPRGPACPSPFSARAPAATAPSALAGPAAGNVSHVNSCDVFLCSKHQTLLYDCQLMDKVFFVCAF